MQQMQLWGFWTIVAAFIVCGCILTRKPRKTLPTKTLESAVSDEHQPGCFAQEEERGGDWKGSGGTEPPVKEACDPRGLVTRDEARRIISSLKKTLKPFDISFFDRVPHLYSPLPLERKT
jgi:hypothetical protein